MGKMGSQRIQIPDFHKNREAAAKLHGPKYKYVKLFFISSVIEKPMGAMHPRICVLSISMRNASQTTGRVSSSLYRQHTLSFKMYYSKMSASLAFLPLLDCGPQECLNPYVLPGEKEWL
jgi:hypothetical protein